MQSSLKLILIFTHLSICAFSQQKNIHSPVNLKVGDLVPEILVTKIINNNKSSVKTSEFKNQLLLIDFWATTCGACVEALPKMDSLQRKFGHLIKILPVNYESVSVVTKFLNKKGYALPSVAEDKTLSRWFRHRTLPHEVWIYKNRVIGITDGQYVDSKNIQRILNGETIDWPVKDDYLIYDYSKPILNKARQETELKSSHALTYTAVTGYQTGATPKIAVVIDSINKTRRNYILNYSILRAYQALWSELIHIDQIPSSLSGGAGNFGGITPTQLKLEVKKPDLYIYNDKNYREEWNRKNFISYECLSADINLEKKKQYQQMIKDLDRLLNLQGRWEKRKIKCLSLVKTTLTDLPKPLNEQTEFIVDQPVKKLRNFSLTNLVYWMNSIFGNPPVFDNTNYQNMVDLDLKASWNDIPSIKRELQRYGLDFKEEEKEIDLFILSEK